MGKGQFHRKCFEQYNMERTQWRSASAGRFMIGQVYKGQKV